MTDSLYRDDRIPPLASPHYTEQVRVLLHDEVARRVAAGGDEHTARGDLAREWVALAVREGGRVPGGKLRTELRAGETLAGRRIDAARTRIRNVWAGHPEHAWALVGTEATVLAGRGAQLPPAWYQQQQKLPL